MTKRFADRVSGNDLDAVADDFFLANLARVLDKAAAHAARKAAQKQLEKRDETKPNSLKKAA